MIRRWNLSEEYALQAEGYVIELTEALYFKVHG